MADPPIAAELGLSRGHFAAYKHIWASAETVAGVLPGAAALKFFNRSGLEAKRPGTLRKIWGLADTEAPLGKLSESEFYRACKLIAHAQAGRPMSVASIAVPAPLPELEGISEEARHVAEALDAADPADLADVLNLIGDSKSLSFLSLIFVKLSPPCTHHHPPCIYVIPTAAPYQPQPSMFGSILRDCARPPGRPLLSP